LLRSEEQPTWGDRIPGLEGLRGLAAVAVLIYHVQRQLAPSTTELPVLSEGTLLAHGVTLFFVLSGFLLFRPFVVARLDNKRMPNTRRYLVNRLLRIFPGYIAVLLVVSLLMRVAWLPPRADGEPSEYGVLTLPQTLLEATLMQSYLPWGVRTGLEVAWTLTVELTFYLMLPLLAAVAARAGKPWVAVAIPVAVMFAVGIAGKLWFVLSQAPLTEEQRTTFEWGANWQSVISRSILVHADLFAYGMLAALFFVALRRGDLPAGLMRFRWVLGVGAAAVLLLSTTNGIGILVEPLVALASALLLLLVAIPRHSGDFGTAARFLEIAPVRWLGLVSFSIYLWHLPLVRYLRHHDAVFADDALGLLGNIALIAALTFVLSALSYYAVEAPSLRLKKRLGGKAPAPAR
jgi:peptidoglycan/LPS O-acetylase OafA/YrhL